ncbi:right-handed parallel beta-helix repeat-containing protein [Aquisphaera giovannonii]|uniref:right-handed parallel beta-helix repeat-containing protein n=1 Tax=Aquisphaera giovannonii TaxID=406548 RepID=UPI001FEA627A|nr:right-handed parallel beta-helix repeat-containing protein [Aquisphaera giovannonii]
MTGPIGRRRFCLLGAAPLGLDGAAPPPAAAAGDWINVRAFGAAGDGDADDAPAIRAALAAAGGRTVFFPVGRYRVTAGFRSEVPVHIRGEGTGAGPGSGAQANDHCTRIVCDFPAGHLFDVESMFPSIFRDFQVNVAPSRRPMARGAAIHLRPPGTATVANYHVEGVAINHFHTGIAVIRPAWGTIRGCYFGDWAGDAISLTTDMRIEGSGGHVRNNYFFGQTSGATQRSCIHLGCGYVHVAENEILGARHGVHCAIANHPAGYIRVFQNTIEEQAEAGVHVESVGDEQATMMAICDNEFSALTNGPTYAASVRISPNGSPGVNFIQDLLISRNITRHVLSADGRHYRIGNGRNVKLADNLLEELGQHGPVGIQVGDGEASGLMVPLVVEGNQFLGGFRQRYLLPRAGTVIVRESQGCPHALLPGHAADGSELFCPDGTPAGPVAAGGPGCFARRLGKAWRA